MKIRTTEVCKICGDVYYAKGLCKFHYQRNKQGVSNDMPKLMEHNPYEIYGDIATFKYFNNKHLPSGEFIVDKNDVERVLQYKWSLISSGYIVAYENDKTILLHRFLMQCPNDKVVDHINHNKKDNRRKNLRIITQKENCYNKIKKPKGITQYKPKNGKKTYYIVQLCGYKGCYKKYEDAEKKVSEIISKNYL